MGANLEREFVEHSTGKLEEFTSRIETCLGKLNEEQVWARGNQNENAIGNLVLHLCGNVRQWIVSGVGGKPDMRERDREFETRGGIPIPELLERLRTTVAEASAVIAAVTPEELARKRVIQKQHDVSGLEAIYHVVEHFAMHTGQIIFATKMLTGADLGFYAHLRSAAQGQQAR
jgi:uncharacterized damage-inducible protein DinB